MAVQVGKVQGTGMVTPTEQKVMTCLLLLLMTDGCAVAVLLRPQVCAGGLKHTDEQPKDSSTLDSFAPCRIKRDVTQDRESALNRTARGWARSLCSHRLAKSCTIQGAGWDWGPRRQATPRRNKSPVSLCVNRRKRLLRSFAAQPCTVVGVGKWEGGGGEEAQVGTARLPGPVPCVCGGGTGQETGMEDTHRGRDW